VFQHVSSLLIRQLDGAWLPGPPGGLIFKGHGVPDDQRPLGQCRPRTHDPRSGPRRGDPGHPTLCWYPKLPVVGELAVSAWSRRRVRRSCSRLRHQGVGGDGGADRVPRGGRKPQRCAPAAARALPGRASEERRPGATPQRVRGVRRALWGRSHALKRSGTSSCATATSAPATDDPARHEYLHLCTRCVRACEDIQSGRVLDVGQRASTPR